LDLYYKQFDDVAHEAMRTINYIPAKSPSASAPAPKNTKDEGHTQNP